MAQSVGVLAPAQKDPGLFPALVGLHAGGNQLVCLSHIGPSLPPSLPTFPIL